MIVTLDDTDWSEHMMRDGHGMILPRVSGLRLRIMEGVAFAVLISDATCRAHLTVLWTRIAMVVTCRVQDSLGIKKTPR
jgi:hypothetical protein